MTSTNDTPLVPSITYHSWNKDQSMIAISPNSNEVWIYETNKAIGDSTKWTRKWVLDEHGGQVSGIDWCHETNNLVTCAHDRNAYVWTFDAASNAWKPKLVILRINRAATMVKWSPSGEKFAVASGAKCVPICYYEASSDWWISKMIKKHKSTVLSLAWCPNNKFVITGSADMKCRVFSAYLENLDSAEDDGFGEVWPNQHQFGEVLAEFDQAKAWVNSVAWSAAGFRLAFAGHGSTIHFVQLLGGSQPVVTTISCKDLPYLDLQFLSDNALIAAGYDFNIDLYTVTGGSSTEPVWALKEKVDKGNSSGPKPAVSSAFGASRAMFGNMVDRGLNAAGGSSVSTPEAVTKHKNIIVNLQLIPNGQSIISKFTSAGIDGRVLVWQVQGIN